MDFAYRPNVMVEDLQPGECTIRRTSGANGAKWWQLWLYVARDDRPGELIDISVPVNPRGSYDENGPGGRTWGLSVVGNGSWTVSPSINVVADAEARAVHAGAHPVLPSIWHRFAVLVNVPSGEPWQ